MNLAQNLATTAARLPDKTAIKLDDAALTYGQLAGMVAQAAGDLRASGLEAGDRVALILPNVPAFPVLFYAVQQVGGVVVPLNPLLKHYELEYFFSDSDAKFAFVWPDFAAEAQQAGEATGTKVFVSTPVGPAPGDLTTGEPITAPVERADDDNAVILYTSGTTGKPKGAQLTHANLHLNAKTSAQDVISIGEDDVIMGCLPLFHVFGLTCSLNAGIIAGATLTLLPRFDPAKALEMVERDKVTIFEGVPTMFGAMLHHPNAKDADMSSLVTCVSGGSAMPVELLRGFESAFDCRVIEGYGLSETSPVVTFNMLDRPSKPGTIGRAIPLAEVRLVDSDGNDVPPGDGVGEIAIRGAYLMKGYWKKPEATAEAIPDGWFRTGDLATVDGDGYFTIVDRKKDMIIRGGLNVYPREIEEVLYQHPAVAEAAVVAIPHAELGEEIGAGVALKAGESATPEELQQFVKDRVAAYKYPRQVWLLAELPKGPTGKILRREVKAPTA
nr:long-chain fatty acid--CoA ligase [Kribbia dieselivorans]